MPKFTDYLISLSTNPQALAALRADPEKAMTDAGLTVAEKNLLLQGDPNAIQQTIAEELGTHQSILRPLFTITITLKTVHINVHVAE